jgi:hypothetical protein
MLEQKQDVGRFAALAAIAQPALQLVGLGIRENAAVHDVDRFAHVDNLRKSSQ